MFYRIRCSPGAKEFSNSKMDCDNLPRYCLVSGYRISWLMNLGNKAFLVTVTFKYLVRLRKWIFSSLLLALAIVFELIKGSVQQVSFVVSWVCTVKTKID